MEYQKLHRDEKSFRRGRKHTDASTIAIFMPKPSARAFSSAAAIAIFAPARVRLSLDCVIGDIFRAIVEEQMYIEAWNRYCASRATQERSDEIRRRRFGP